MNILKVGETGTFEELSSKGNPDMLIVSYVPPISTMLERDSGIKGESLSETEIDRIKRNASTMAIPKDIHDATFEDSNK